MRCFFLTSLFLLPLSGQMLIPPDSDMAARLAPFFEAQPKGTSTPLACSILPIPARLSFGFRYWTGYDISLPARQFADSSEGKQRQLVVSAKIQNEAGVTNYLWSSTSLPEKLPGANWALRGVEFDLGGGFLAGEGKYKVMLLIIDGRGRECRKSWTASAKKLSVPMRIPPGEVRENGMDGWRGIPAKAGASSKVTVFLHAAPIYRRRNTVKLSAWDRTVLLGSLTSFLETSRFSDARVVVFDLDGRSVLYETETFDRRSFRRLINVLDNANRGTVSLKTLNGPGEAGFLELLVRAELDRKQNSDAVVFLGPSWRYGGKLTPLLRELRGQFPETFYVSLTPWFDVADDLLTRFTNAGKGKVLSVYEPTDLAKAIRKIDEVSAQ